MINQNASLNRRTMLQLTGASVLGATALTGRTAGQEDGVEEFWQFETDASDPITSPTIMGNTVFFGSQEGSFYAVDVATGEQQWVFEADGFISTAPAISDNGIVFFGSADNNLYGVDAETGDTEIVGETAGSITVSPAVVDGTVMFASGDGNLYAVDINTGEQEWRFVPDGFASGLWTAPTVVDNTVYIGQSDDLYAVDATTGSGEWTFETGGTIDEPPTVADGIVFVGSRDNNFYAVDAATGDQQWEFNVEQQVGVGWTAPTVAQGTVFVAFLEDNLYALEAATGDEKWSFDPVTQRNAWDASPTVVGDTVFAGSRDDNLYVFDVENGEQQMVTEVGSVSASPVIVDGVLFIPDFSRLRAINVGVDGSSEDSRVTLNTLGHYQSDQPDISITDEDSADDTADGDEDSADDTAGSDENGETTGDTDDDVPGFGFGAAVASLAGVSYLLKRQIEDDDRS